MKLHTGAQQALSYLEKGETLAGIARLGAAVEEETKEQQSLAGPTLLWLVWSFEHKAWWRDNYSGYTKDRKEAGRYSFDVARTIVKMANQHTGDSPEETMCPDY